MLEVTQTFANMIADRLEEKVAAKVVEICVGPVVDINSTRQYRINYGIKMRAQLDLFAKALERLDFQEMANMASMPWNPDLIMYLKIFYNPAYLNSLHKYRTELFYFYILDACSSRSRPTFPIPVIQDPWFSPENDKDDLKRKLLELAS